MDDLEAVWAETTGGGLLKDLFGYYPTMHDARIRRIVFDRQENSVEMLMHYYDATEVNPAAGDLHVLVVLTWLGVRAFEMTIDDNDLMRMEIARKDDLIRMDFTFCCGTSGHIESERFEARLEKLDPLLDKDEAYNVTLVYR